MNSWLNGQVAIDVILNLMNLVFFCDDTLILATVGSYLMFTSPNGAFLSIAFKL